MPDASKSDAIKGLSEILAAQRIAKERDPGKGGKAIVIRNDHEKEDKRLLEQKAGEIRRDPAFRTMVQGLSDDPKIRRSQVSGLCSDGGNKLSNSLERTRRQMQEEAVKTQ